LKIFFGIAAVFGLLVFLYNINLLGGVGGALGRVILPLSGAVSDVKNNAVGWAAAVFNPAKIIDENNRLAYESSRSVIDRARLGALAEENLLLKKELDFRKKSSHQTILAKIIGKNNLDDAETVIINKGKNDGVSLGRAVVYADGILIGKLIKVSDSFSLVRLVTDNETSVAATTLNSDHTTGVVSGEHGLSLKMDLIPQNEQIAVGDLVITSGLESGIPRGLVLGSIDSVIKEVRNPFQTAIIRSPANFNNLDYVLVIIGE